MFEIKVVSCTYGGWEDINAKYLTHSWGVPVLLHIKTTLCDLFRNGWLGCFYFFRMKIAHLGTWWLCKNLGLYIFLYKYVCHTVQYLLRYLSWKYQDEEKSVHKLGYANHSELPSLWFRDYSFVVVLRTLVLWLL